MESSGVRKLMCAVRRVQRRDAHDSDGSESKPSYLAAMASRVVSWGCYVEL